MLDYDMGWRDANHNLGSRGDDGQRACKKQSDQSLKNHDTLSLFIRTKLRTVPAAGASPSSSPPEEVAHNQQNH